MAAKSRLLYVSNPTTGINDLPPALRESAEVVVVHNPLRALATLAREPFDAIFVTAEHFQSALRLRRLLENDRILEGMPDAVALLDSDFSILWANHQLLKWCNRGNIVGERFFAALGNPDVVGCDGYPLLKAAQSGLANSSLLKMVDGRHYQMHAAPITDPEDKSRHLVVTIRDVTVETHQQQKLEAIQNAGRELADMKPDEIFAMPVDQRIDMLKANILHCTQDILKYDVVEIRLLDRKTKKLVALLDVGMDEEAVCRELYAKETGNGVTGFVAATGKSYLCEDTANDPLYLTGVTGAKSSLTVPLKLHNEVIGTFNVESPQPHAFTDSDLQFLNMFCRDVAMSLNTLQLLVAQQMNAAQESVAQIHSQVALPIDEIVADATFIDEQAANLDEGTRARLKKILDSASSIRDVIQKVGRSLPPADIYIPPSCDKRDKLKGKRVLVVDAEPSVLNSAHKLLEQHECHVQTAQQGADAEAIFRHNANNRRYDVVIAGVKLPDMSAYELMMRLKPLVDRIPLILTQEFGWDAGHTLVKCRAAGLHPSGCVIKPFKERQLLDTVETIIDWTNGAKA